MPIKEVNVLDQNYYMTINLKKKKFDCQVFIKHVI